MVILVVNNSTYLQFIDISLTGNVQRHESVLLHSGYTLVSLIGSPKVGIFWALLIAFLLWGFKYKIPALWTLGTVYGGDALNEIIKHLVRRQRPPLHPLADTGYSFPSAHVMNTFLILSVIWFVAVPLIQHRGLRIVVQILCWIGVAVVMLARIYLNAHYPTDTIGGLMIAYGWLQVCETLYVMWAPKLHQCRLTEHSYL